MFLLTGSSSEAEDLAQEAMIPVYERWEHVSMMDAPTGYLFRTALNLERERQPSPALRASSSGCSGKHPPRSC